MKFHVGKIVIHPTHGALRVETLSARVVRGTAVPYVLFRLVEGDLGIQIPVEGWDVVGLREVMTSAEAERVFDAFRAPSIPREKQWARRMKDFDARVASGRIEDLIVVVREIIRDRRDKVSFSENRMLREAKQRIVRELRIALGTDERTIELRITEAALGLKSEVRLA